MKGLPLTKKESFHSKMSPVTIYDEFSEDYCFSSDSSETFKETLIFKSSGDFETVKTGTTTNRKSFSEKQPGNNISEKLMSCRVEFC